MFCFCAKVTEFCAGRKSVSLAGRDSEGQIVQERARSEPAEQLRALELVHERLILDADRDRSVRTRHRIVLADARHESIAVRVGPADFTDQLPAVGDREVGARLKVGGVAGKGRPRA
jgi:hypothetical protein